MARLSFPFGLLVFAAALAGCATSRVPAFDSAAIAPAELLPGQTAVITVEVRDYHRIIDRIDGAVEGYPELTFKLRDDGATPDVEADDGVWTMDVSVPFTAPAGEHTIRFRAYDSRGRVIPVPDAQGNATELSTDISVRITYPETPAEPTEPAPQG